MGFSGLFCNLSCIAEGLAIIQNARSKPTVKAITLLFCAIFGSVVYSATEPLALVDSLWTNQLQVEAHAAVDSLLPAAREARDEALIAGLLLRRGQMHAALGNGREAEAPLREALALAEAGSDTGATCSSLRWLGVALFYQGRPDEVFPLLQKQRTLARTAGLRELEAWAIVGFGYCAGTKGDNDTAKAEYGLAVAMFAELDRPEAELFALNSYGNTCQFDGDFQGALDCYERTAFLSEELGNIFLQAMAINNLGTLEFQLGDPGKAAAYFHHAAELFHQDGNRQEELNSCLNEALCFTMSGRHEQAREILTLVAEEVGFPNLRNKALGRLAADLNSSGSPEAAASDLRLLLNDPGALILETHVYLAVQLAEIIADLDGPAAGLEVLAEHEEFLVGKLSTGLRVFLATTKGRLQQAAGLHEEALVTLVAAADESDHLGLLGDQLSALPPAAAAARSLGQDELALVLLERARASWLAERSLPADPEWREIYGAHGRLVATELAALLLDTHGRQPDDPGPGLALAALQTFKARSLRERMLGPGAESPQESAFDLALFQREVLVEGEVFLDCAMGPRRTFVFAVTKKECRVVELPGEKDLGSRLRLFHQLVSGPARGERQVGFEEGGIFSGAAKALHRDLLAPFEDLLTVASRLIFCPDGSLNLLPIAVLLETEGQVFPEGIQRVPAASVLADLRSRSTASSTGPAAIAVLAGTTDGQGRALPGVQREMASLRLFGGQTVALTDSTERALVIPWAEVLHIAAHATANDQAPWRSAIHLDAEVGGGSCDLAAGSIADLRLGTQLVVLSSCETAAGRILTGEGVQGLATAFLAAGAPVVLATLWPVDDQATAHLMELFYGALARDESPAAALGQAQQKMGTDSRWSDPYFRYGFVLLGDGSRPIPIKKSGHPMVWPAGLTGAACVGFLLFLRRRKILKGGA